MNSPEVSNWSIAICKEFESIKKNNVWRLVDKKDNINVIDTHWVFVMKYDTNQYFYKADLLQRALCKYMVLIILRSLVQLQEFILFVCYYQLLFKRVGPYGN